MALPQWLAVLIRAFVVDHFLNARSSLPYRCSNKVLTLSSSTSTLAHAWLSLAQFHAAKKRQAINSSRHGLALEKPTYVKEDLYNMIGNDGRISKMFCQEEGRTHLLLL